jgi:perosamine synthetase
MNRTSKPIKEIIPLISITENRPVRDVLRVIDAGALGLALLVETGTEKFKGLLTDGDVRRALLQGATLDSPASQIPCPRTVTAHVDTPLEEITARFSEKIRFIPLLDDEGRVVDISAYDSRMHIPVASPAFSGNELKYVTDCVLTGWVSSAGKYVTAFENMFAEYCNTRFAVATSSGTTALHLALLALGIGPGDEVIVPSLTFISTANAVRFTGARPVFVDSEPETWNIDPALTEKAVTERTKAVIPVHLYGHPANMDPILNLARRHELSVIEDAAEAHGAMYKGQKVGSLGDLGMFSFYGNKTITTGEGGMVVTNNEDLARQIRLLRDHGMDPERRYVHTVLGYNYRMTNIQAALGVAQMEYIDDILTRKIANAGLYDQGLREVPGITLPPQAPWCRNIYWLYSILVDENTFGMSASQLGLHLQSKNIDTRPLFPPIHQQPIYNTGVHLQVCETLYRKGLSLPSSVSICKNTIQVIVDIIRKAVT